MPDLLLFTLWGPLAAMGEVTVGERRTGWDRPGRSAILGLVAAALGIEREAEAAHAALDAGYGYAVRVELPGTLIEDYHTAQVPPARKGRRWPTRRAELAESRLETILSLRDYRADARHTVALWSREGAPHTLEQLAASLRRPHFALCLGRRACPLGLPPAPRIVAAATLEEGFRHFEAAMGEEERELRAATGPAGWTAIYADADAGTRFAAQARQTVRRRDAPLSRRRRQFGLREELVILPEAAR